MNKLKGSTYASAKFSLGKAENDRLFALRQSKIIHLERT